jgi:DNA polymerase-3 subunit gamma/tau
MAYQVLARKHRPQRFEDVISQGHVTRTLINAMANGRVSSAYLFTGPRGTGKTTTARILAKAINCVNGPTPTPCGECPACVEITAGSSLDVLEIDAASNTGVDDVRTLRENARYLPASGRYRIYIIDEVHRLSGSAFDALLKILEEPPAHVMFIFATTEPQKVPETIRSRTQRYDFHRVPVSDLSLHLARIAALEEIEIDEDALKMLARKADGSVRDAISLLDQLSAYAGEKITGRHVTEALGLIESRFYFDYVEAIAAKNAPSSLEMIGKLIESGAKFTEFCIGLAEHFRNLMILKNARQPEKLLELSETEIESFQKQVDYFSTGDILRIIRITNDMILDLKNGLAPRLVLEVSTIRLASLESTIHFEDIIARLSAEDETPPGAAEGDLFGTANSSALPAASNEKAVMEKTAVPEESFGSTVTRAINLPMVQTNWSKYIEHLKRENPMLSALLAMAEIRDVKDNVITALFHNAGGTSKQVVEKPNYLSVINTTLHDFFNANLRIRFEVDLSKSPAAPSQVSIRPTDPENEKILKEDKKLKDIMERFDGEIMGKKNIDETQ